MSLTKELVNWQQEQRCRKAVETLGQKGFTALYYSNSDDARAYIIHHSADACSVGFGGSRSTVDLGL